MLYLELIVGLIAIIVGANYMVDSAVVIAKRFRIPDIVIGMTLVALGTSAPEITVSFVGASKGLSDIAFGNVVGSNICNILFALGVTTIIYPLTITRQNRIFDIPGVLILTLLTLIIGKVSLQKNNIIDGEILFSLNKFGGYLLLVIGVLFILISYLMTKRLQKGESQAEEQKISIIFQIGRAHV